MTVVEIANLALLNLGVSTFITSTNDQTQEALTVARVHDTTLRACLRRHPWSFATKYAALVLAAGPFWETDPTKLVLVQTWDTTKSYAIGDVVRYTNVNWYAIAASTGVTPVEGASWSTLQANAPVSANGDWLYSYRYPSDCLFARRIVPPWMVPYARQYNPDPVPMRRHRDENGLLISTSMQAAVLEYTMLDCADLWTDDWFVKYFTWMLAAAMVPSLERSQKTAIECIQIAESYLSIACRSDMQEQQQEKPGEPDWIRGR